jgi:hypothetical protein
MTSPKESKRQKVNGVEEIASQLWESYSNFLDSLNGEESNDTSGDIDELHELIELSKSHVTKHALSSKDDGPSIQWGSVADLLPILVSVAYWHLAESAIAEYLHPNGSTEEQAQQIKSLLVESLEYYPKNAATWSMGANFGRMTDLLSLSTARKWYERAAEDASQLRTRGLEILNDESVEDGMLKEWIELLILNQVVGVEFEIDDDVEATTNQEEIEDEEEDVDGDEDDEAEGHYSASSVEGTSRFMYSMLASMEGKHDDVMKHLPHFGFTHRLHPNVWKTTSPMVSKEIPEKPPLIFCPDAGILPDHLYEGMKRVFAPGSAYWLESNYIGRGYYSYFMDFDAGISPRNIIEDVIVNHLLPRAKQMLSKEDGDSICGFEWWTHTRPIKANLGHNLHFDTDESLLAQDGKVTHPILSSVLYLTGGSGSMDDPSPGGTTIILNQTPHSMEVANHCWQGNPVDNSFLLFQGDRLHGVLPCPGTSTEESEIQEHATLSELWNDWKSPEINNSKKISRLTFMVGFWTRNVPATMKERHLYGPCGPLPPSTSEHTWIQEISQGYSGDGNSARKSEPSAATITPSALPQVSPAWQSIEPITTTDSDDDDQAVLHVPKSIDHRFFVKGAPRCFYDSLFEKDSGECE